MALPVFSVNDIVKVTRYYPNGTNLSTGAQGKVTQVDTSGRYVQYTVEFEATHDPYGYRNSTRGPRSYALTASNLEFVEKAKPAPKPVTFTHPETIALAQKVIEVAQREAEKHGWCNVVDKALREAGLGAYIGTTKTVRVTVDVPVSVEPGTNVNDAEFIRLAQEKVRTDATLTLNAAVTTR